MAIALTAHAPTPALLTRLANAGWGELGGRSWQGVRSVLEAVARSLPYKSAAGMTSAPQIAARAGLSERWVRRCLTLLEELEIISWHRGMVIEGKPTPSHIRINKQRIVDLIKLAWPAHNAKEARRRRETLQRIRAVKARYFRGKQGKKQAGQVHAELSASPTHSNEWRHPNGVPHTVESSAKPTKETSMKIACAHNSDCRDCHKCVTHDTPPIGYHYDQSLCTTCNKNRQGHELMVKVERSVDGSAHMFTPRLVRIEAS